MAMMMAILTMSLKANRTKAQRDFHDGVVRGRGVMTGAGRNGIRNADTMTTGTTTATMSMCGRISTLLLA